MSEMVRGASPSRPLLVSIVVVVAMLAGCATQPRSADYYKRGDALREQTVRMAVVESVREVTIDRDSNGVGTLAGAVIGGIAGSGVGKGRGSAIGATAGAVLGGAVGEAIDGGRARVPAVEITVRLADGSMVAIVQEPGSAQLRPGDTVRLLSSRGATRVVPA